MLPLLPILALLVCPVFGQISFWGNCPAPTQHDLTSADLVGHVIIRCCFLTFDNEPSNHYELNMLVPIDFNVGVVAVSTASVSGVISRNLILCTC